MPGCVKTRNRKGNDVLGHLARLDRQIDHIARVRQLQGYVATEISRVLEQLLRLKRPETLIVKRLDLTHSDLSRRPGSRQPVVGARSPEPEPVA